MFKIDIYLYRLLGGLVGLILAFAPIAEVGGSNSVGSSQL